MTNELDEPSMLPEYKKVLDTFGLKHIGNGCYTWNGYWLVSYYGDKEFFKWAVMQGVRKEWIKQDPFISLSGCKFLSPEELQEQISDILRKYNKVKEEIKLENIQKDFK